MSDMKSGMMLGKPLAVKARTKVKLHHLACAYRNVHDAIVP